MSDQSLSQVQPQKTALYDLHIKSGARMVCFAGYQLPVSYSPGIIKEHCHTRHYAGLFDISHMGQIHLSGEQAGIELERLVPGNLQGLKNHRQRYTVLTNQQGGILDDLIVARDNDDWRLVVNAACKQQDFEHLRNQLPAECAPALLTDQSLLALQGPLAVSVLDSVIDEGCADIAFMATSQVVIRDIPCRISRCGYTGEDGYELSVANQHAPALANLLLQHEHVKLIGLGARDTLRLEAGLCLYGQDIDATTTPVEAGLGWVVDRHYLKSDGKQPGFPGAQIILQQLQSGVARQRVGLKPEGRVPVREGAELFNRQGERVGHVTSGGFGPSIGKPIAMGYVASDHSAIGSRLMTVVREREIMLEVVSLPFVAHHYHRSS